MNTTTCAICTSFVGTAPARVFINLTHDITNLPPLFTVNVTLLSTVNGPVTCAFSVANIVVSAVKFCAFVLNKPPALKLPLFSAAGVTVPVCGARKFTKILASSRTRCSSKCQCCAIWYCIC